MFLKGKLFLIFISWFSGRLYTFGSYVFFGNFEIAQYENWSSGFLFKMFNWKVEDEISRHGGRCLCQCLPLSPFISVNFQGCKINYIEH